MMETSGAGPHAPIGLSGHSHMILPAASSRVLGRILSANGRARGADGLGADGQQMLNRNRPPPKRPLSAVMTGSIGQKNISSAISVSLYIVASTCAIGCIYRLFGGRD